MEEIKIPGQELPVEETEAQELASAAKEPVEPEKAASEPECPAEQTADEPARAETEASAPEETAEQACRQPECPAAPAAPKGVEVVDVRFRNNAKNYYFDPNGLTLKAGEHVIIETARGDEFGLCAAGNHTVPAGEVVAPLRRVLRRATAQDEKVNADNQLREKKAFEVCQKKIADHKLEMQLVSEVIDT